MESKERKKDFIIEKAAISYIEQESKKIRERMEVLKEEPTLKPSEEQRDKFLHFMKVEQDRIAKKRRQKHAIQFVVILLVVIVGFTSVNYVFVEAFRARVLYMLRNFKETHVEIGVGDIMDLTEGEQNLVQYLLPGFRVVGYDKNQHEESIYAENDSGYFISVNQLDEESVTNVDTEDAIVLEIQADIGTISIIEREELNSALWKDGLHYYILHTNVNVELLKEIFD